MNFNITLCRWNAETSCWSEPEVIAKSLPWDKAIRAAEKDQKARGVKMPDDHNVSLCGQFLYDLEYAL